MSPAPPRDTPSGRTYNNLRNLARRQGRDVAEYLSLFVLEGFLARLSASQYADQLILKGGVLMAAFSARRPTRDIDLSASGFPNDVVEAEGRVRSIAAIGIDDDLIFVTSSVRGGGNPRRFGIPRRPSPHHRTTGVCEDSVPRGRQLR